MLLIPEVDDLDTAIARQSVREQIAACDRCTAMLSDAFRLAREQRLLEDDALSAIGDLQANLAAAQRQLDEVLGKAMGIADSRAPRRASAELLGRIAS